MTSASSTNNSAAHTAATGFLDKESTIAKPGFNRWLVPPAALCIHLSIGMAYGFSVFWPPLTKALGISKPLACPDAGMLDLLTSTTCDWTQTAVTVTFSLFIVALGLAAAVWGGWLERVGPRKAGLVAALCWSSGLALGALGIWLHQLWILWLGTGIVGGIGLGLGYISPVSTLIKWFPDRRGMATGMAIMGFGGGAMIGTPLADRLIKYFATPDSVGVWQTFLVLAVIYLIFMVGGALGYRVPPTGWKPAGWTPPAKLEKDTMITQGQVHLNTAWKTPQFWLIWMVLCMNVTAGISVLAVAVPMLQEVFGGHLLGLDITAAQLSGDQLKQMSAIAAGFAGLLSLFNIGGRFFWASMSDRLGRKLTYSIFFLLAIALYASAPTMGHTGQVGLFVAIFCVILSMYGGGFATVPAYLSDMFGTQFVGAIHGRLLTAWSTAGVIGPLLINYIRDAQIAAGVPKAQVYDRTMYILVVLLLIGLICNLLVRPVARKYFMTDAQIAEAKLKAHEVVITSNVQSDAQQAGGFSLGVALAWLVVGIPIAWGAWVTLQKAAVLF